MSYQGCICSHKELFLQSCARSLPSEKEEVEAVIKLAFAQSSRMKDLLEQYSYEKYCNFNPLTRRNLPFWYITTKGSISSIDFSIYSNGLDFDTNRVVFTLIFLIFCSDVEYLLHKPLIIKCLTGLRCTNSKTLLSICQGTFCHCSELFR